MLKPVTATLDIVSVPLPVFVIVNIWAAPVLPTATLLKLRLVAENATAGTAPVPVSLTASGLSDALSVIVTDAIRVPGAVGAKVTPIMQLVPAATEVPHVLA